MSNDFAYCACGRTKYRRTTLRWYVAHGTSWHYVKSLKELGALLDD